MATIYELAAASWEHLIECAAQGRDITYEDLGVLVGNKPAVLMGEVLDPLQAYCERNGLPALTGLIVNKGIRLPSEGFTGGVDPGWRDKVLAWPWASAAAPSAADLAVLHQRQQNDPAPAATTGARRPDIVAMDDEVEHQVELASRREAFDPDDEEDARERIAASIAMRRGQQKFRAGLMRIYEGRCALTGSAVTEVLEAAHICRYLGDKSNPLTNGLLLRADVHTLFDLGLIVLERRAQEVVALVDPSLDGTEYEQYHLKSLRPPTDPSFAPSKQALEKHASDTRPT